MSPKRAFPGATRVAFDFLLGLGLFAFLTALACGGDIAGLSAAAADMAWPPEFAAFDVALPPALQQTRPAAQHLPALITLGLAFATTFALNMWFARHVSRVYVVARHSGQKP